MSLEKVYELKNEHLTPEKIKKITLLDKVSNLDENIICVETSIKTTYQKAYIYLSKEISNKFFQGSLNFTQMALRSKKVSIENPATFEKIRYSKEKYAQDQILLINCTYSDSFKNS